MRKVAVVVLSGTTRDFDKQYHYLVPENMEGAIKTGVRAIVPFGGGNSLKEGYVIGFAQSSAYKNLKYIKKIIDKEPVLSEAMIDLACWMKERYLCTYSQAIKCMLPAGIGVKSLKVIKLLNEAKGLSKSKQSIVDTLSSNDGILEFKELKELSGVKSSFNSHIKDLETAGIVLVNEQYSTAVKKKTVKAASLAMKREDVLEEIESGSLKRIQQIRVLEMLLENEFIAVSDIVRFARVSASTLDTLCKNGYIYYQDIVINRNPLKHRQITSTLPMELTPEQKKAMEAAYEALDSRRFREILLHGVTGSGKTEVYLQLIQHVLDTGKKAITLVPEISLTPQMVDWFRGRFGENVAVLHSRLSPGERYDQWRLIKSGAVSVVVGARSAVFAPLENIGIIIIDEEHENSYKSETTPKYSAHEIAVRRCMHEGALLLYGSATPSIVTYHRALDKEIGLIKMKKRVSAHVMPKIHLADMRRELESGNRTMFSSLLSQEIEKNIAKGEQTILFLNRRGFASFILCRSCGLRIKCKECNITMTYHLGDNRLLCHYCGYTIKLPAVCPKCGSSAIRQFGTGTQRVEEELKKHFPGCSVIRMDMDTTSGKRSHEEILDTFRNENINILVGTQMVAKGHDFPNVTLVGVLAADSLLGIDDYRASERTFQLLTQVAGRAGRGSLPGRAVIQTYNIDDYSITCSCNHDYEEFYRQELDIRRRLNYPPFSNIACIVVSSLSDKYAFEKAREVYSFICQDSKRESGDEILPGPMRPPISKLRNRYRWRIVIKSSSVERLADIMASVSDKFCRERGGKKNRSRVDINMDINPGSMM